MKHKTKLNWLIHIFFILLSLTFVIPMIYVLSVSFSSQASIDAFGYKLIPPEFSLEAYKFVFKNPTQLINSYKVTIFTSLVGTFLSLTVMALVAFPLSQKSFRYRKPIMYMIFFTMLFSGGLIPHYILTTRYLGLGNSIWVYILPTLASAYHIIILRTFFQQLPVSLIESARLDGASDARIFASIVLPLSKPVLATIALMTMLNKWNDWYTTLIYVRDSELYTLQYMLQKILREVQFVKEVSQNGMAGNLVLETSVPEEPARFAMVIIAAGPMLVIFPFFQKYFTRGLTLGSVKG